MKKILALFLVLATVLSLMTVGAYAAADNALSVSCKLYDGYTVVTVQKSGTVYYTTDGSKPTSKSKKLNSTRIKVSEPCSVRLVSYVKGKPAKLRTVVVTAIELLSGIPSVVFGLLGMQVLVPAVAKAFGKASGACLLSAIVVLSIMILPSIVSVSVTALNAVPPEYEQGSLALGATNTETWFKISLPAAQSGIAAGVVLGIGRAIGEAMAVMMVAGNSPNMPDSLFRSVTLLTTAIAKEMSYAGGLQRQALFSIALVLFVFIMLINVVLNVILKGGNRDE